MTFDDYYKLQYGERWSRLKESLLRQKPRHFLLTNPYGEPHQDFSLDEASVNAAQALPLENGIRLADFCAAPGGKSLSLIFRAYSENFKIQWHLNDMSKSRVQRLKAVLHDCLPDDEFRKLKITSGNAGLWGKHYPESFDRILVDVPCSGERHLLHTPQELARWSAKSSQRLSMRQNALLCSALDALVPGGYILYSTCSISRTENDGTLDRFSKSREGQFEIQKLGAPGEETKYGRMILPDTAGCGPIFYSLIKKL